MSKPRVLYLIPHMAMGGAERQLSILLRLHADRVTQHLALIYSPTIYPFFYRDHIKGIPVSNFDKHLGKLGWPALGWRYARLLAAFRPDIVHAYKWQAMDMVRVFHRMMPLPRPLLIVNPQIPLVEVDRQRIPIERRLIAYTDHIVAVSPLTAEEYRQEIPASEGRITTIGNSVDAAFFAPGERAAARKESLSELPPEAAVLLYLGRFDKKQKNLDGLLQAVGLLRDSNRWPQDAHLVCVGRADEPECESAFKAIVQEQNLVANVTFLPEAQDVRPYYHACDALLLPSHYEGLPHVMLEASACARPTLISQEVNRADLVIPGKTGWAVPADDVQGIAEGLSAILNTPRADRDRMGMAARDYILPRFEAKSMAEDYLALYNRLIDSRKR